MTDPEVRGELRLHERPGPPHVVNKRLDCSLGTLNVWSCEGMFDELSLNLVSLIWSGIASYSL